jgi:guanosine-3',5'-bis(diphosphate) 3'-pyrophosphohydrolase
VTNLSELRKKSELVDKAYNFSKEAHGNQKRLSGEPYFNHAIKTAEYLTEWGIDETTIAAGLLHDVVEDTDVTSEEIGKEFGEEIRFLVDGVSKLGQVKYRGDEKQIENLRKLIISMAEDVRVIIIKLADRLHNMRTLDVLNAQKRRRIAMETMEVYAPLAYQLGMQKLSGELQDIAFPYVYPEEHRWLIRNIKERYREREHYLKKLKPVVEKAIEENGIKIIDMDFRAKRYNSLYKKLLRYEMDIDKVYDLVAFRIIVKSIEDCYATLGIVHNLWPPLPGRIKDYIAAPKPNGYRSLHTSIFGPEQKIVEFQIRTELMHHEAENGIAAHWIYKDAKTGGRRKSPEATKQEVAIIEQLRAWKNINEFANPKEFIDAFKIDFLKDRIFTITPKGEVIDLPYGATPVDFAYQIHSEIGNQCVAAKANGKIVPLDYKLQSRDVVEIITQKGKKPSSSWLNFVITTNAKNHIRNALRDKIGGTILETPKQHVELKIVAEQKIGLIKDISTIISRSHIGIVSIQSPPPPTGRFRKNFRTIKVVCDTNNKDKIMKIILKLKSLKSVKEIDYRFV